MTLGLHARPCLLYTLYDYLEDALLCSLDQFKCLLRLLKLESVCNELLHIDLARRHQIDGCRVASD